MPGAPNLLSEVDSAKCQVINQRKDKMQLIIKQHSPVRYMVIIKVSGHVFIPGECGMAQVDIVFKGTWAVTQGTRGAVLLRIEEVQEGVRTAPLFR